MHMSPARCAPRLQRARGYLSVSIRHMRVHLKQALVRRCTRLQGSVTLVSVPSID